MKKFFSLIAAVLFAGSMMATEVTFTKDDFAGQGTANTGSEVSATKDGVTFTFSKGYCANESLRCYAHGALSITAEATIEKINFTTTGGKTGGLDAEVTVGATSYSVEDLASQARFTEIKVTLGGDVPPTPTMDYYVAGSMTGWAPVAAYKLAAYPANEGEYMGEFTFAANDEFKVGYSDGTTIESTNYFPNGIDNNYVITEAGDYTVYFRPDGQGGEDWHYGCINAVKKEPLADPTNCAEAAAAALSVSANNELYNNGAFYTIEGYVTSIAYAWKSGSMSFWMADAADGGNVLEAYKCIADEADAVRVGDKVQVTGSLTKYNTTPEFAQGCTVTIIERAEVVDPVNLGEKTIAEFLELANTKDTCILTGVIADVVNAQYGNFYLVEETDSLYVYGLKDAAGAYCFETESLAEGDTLKVLAIYSTYNNKPQAKNAIFVEVKKAVVVEHTYTVAGMESVFGTNWTPSDANNDMTKQEDGTYKWEKENLELAAGNVEFKVCEDHAWTVSYPAQNYNLAIEEAGIYTITITFNAETKEVAAVATKTGSAEIDPVVSIAGSMNSWNASANVMTLAEDKQTATLTLSLDANTYEFKVVLNGGEWRSNAQDFTRENASATDMTGNEANMHLVADVAGDYVFTWTFADNSLVITYPDAPVVPDTIDVVATNVRWTDATASAGWWQIIGVFGEYNFSISNISASQAPGIYTMAEDLDPEWTYLKKYNEDYEVVDSIGFVDGQVEVAISADDVVTVVGALVGDNGNVYMFNLSYKDPVVETTVNIEIPEWQVGDTYFASYGIFALAGQAANGDYVQLDLITDGATIAGVYTEEDEDPYEVYGSGIIAGGAQQNIFSFTATIAEQAENGRALVTADILCYNNTLYHVTTLVGEGVDAVEAAVKAIKRIVNGQVVIEKAGKTYNMNGAVVR